MLPVDVDMGDEVTSACAASFVDVDDEVTSARSASLVEVEQASRVHVSKITRNVRVLMAPLLYLTHLMIGRIAILERYGGASRILTISRSPSSQGCSATVQLSVSFAVSTVAATSSNDSDTVPSNSMKSRI